MKNVGLNVSRIAVVIVVLFLLIPAGIIILGSFSSEQNLTFPPSELSLETYINLLTDGGYLAAMRNSLIVGIFSVVVGIPIALAAAYGLRSLGGLSRGLFYAFLMLGMVSPLVVSGVAYLLTFLTIGIYGNIFAVSLAVMTVNLPFAILLLSGAVDRLDKSQSQAAQTLGAESLQTFLFVELPQIRPAAIASGLLLFVLGIGEFLVSMIVTNAASATLPVQIFASLRTGLTPTMAAVAGLYVIFTAVVIAFLYRYGVLRYLYTVQNQNTGK